MTTSKRNSIRTVGLIGAGVMGQGIAEVSVRAGLRVRILDCNADAAALAVQNVRERVDDHSLVSEATSDADLADADLVIEAVPEDFALKTAILMRVERHLNDRTVIASNSSSLSIAKLGEVLRNPGRFCGMHFCHPVRARPLVEVVHSNKTSAETTSRAFDCAKTIGMAPVVVLDSPGFLLNRLLVPYMNEALELILHGAEVQMLDRTAREFGMPLRPLELFDEFGFDVAFAVGRSLYQSYPDRIVPSELLIAVYKSGRRGRKSGGGFYRTREDARRGQIDPEVAELIRKRRRGSEPLSDDIVRKRLFLPMLLEATRVREEGLVTDHRMIETTLQNGLGLTSHDAGIFAWADRIGVDRIVRWLQTFQFLGTRFEPTRLLLDCAGRGMPMGERRNNAA